MTHPASQGKRGRRSPYGDAGFVATYDRLAVPYQFAGPARDLVRMLNPSPEARVLDVGAGTGAATIPAAQALGPGGFAVALDRSLEMLAVLRTKCRARPVAGEAPGLPFASSTFDAVMANFVLSHMKNYELALKDMVRVLKPAGRLGVTAWPPGGSEASLLWRSVATKFVSEETLAQGFRELVPWDEWFSEHAHLHQALTEAELLNVEIIRREYPISISVTDFLEMREASIEGRVLEESLGPDERDEMKRQMTDAFRSRFKDHIEYAREVYLAHGTKPPG